MGACLPSRRLSTHPKPRPWLTLGRGTSFASEALRWWIGLNLGLSPIRSAASFPFAASLGGMMRLTLTSASTPRLGSTPGRGFSLLASAKRPRLAKDSRPHARRPRSRQSNAKYQEPRLWPRSKRRAAIPLRVKPSSDRRSHPGEEGIDVRLLWVIRHRDEIEAISREREACALTSAPLSSSRLTTTSLQTAMP